MRLRRALAIAALTSGALLATACTPWQAATVLNRVNEDRARDIVDGPACTTDRGESRDLCGQTPQGPDAAVWCWTVVDGQLYGYQTGAGEAANGGCPDPQAP